MLFRSFELVYGELKACGFEESNQMMGLDNFPKPADLLGQFRDGSGFFICDRFIKKGESVSYFWVRKKVQSSRVWTGASSLGGSYTIGASLVVFSGSILKII